MAGLDWDAIEKEANEKKFKDYAENGIYRVTLKSVEAITVPPSSNSDGLMFNFEFEEDDVKYPNLRFSLFKDASSRFRAHYYKEVIKELGASEENARKAVDVCESKSNREDIHHAYGLTFDKLAKKHPKIDIEVRDQIDFRTGEPKVSAKGTVYGESVFTNKNLRFSDKNRPTPQAKPAEVVPEDIPEGDDLLGNIPF